MANGPETASSHTEFPAPGREPIKPQTKRASPQVPTWQTRLDQLFPRSPMDPDMVPVPRVWHAPGLIMAGKINGLFGAEKAGKSRFLRFLMAHVYSGSPVLGEPTLAFDKTLYLAGEETDAEVVDDLRTTFTRVGLDYRAVDWPETIHFVSASGMRLDQPQTRDWLQNLIVREGYKTLVIDPLRRVHGGRESDNDEMSRITNALRDWSNSAGLTIVLVHHTGKLGIDEDETRIATWSRGATDLPTILDWAVYMRRQVRRGQDLVVIQRSGRAKKWDPFTLVDLGEEPPGWAIHQEGP